MYSEDEVRAIIDNFLPEVQSLTNASMSHFDLSFWPRFKKGEIKLEQITIKKDELNN